MKVPGTRKKYITVMMLIALLIVVIEIISIVISVNIWSFVPFIIGIVVCLALALVLSEYYYSGSTYKCPDCGAVIKPTRGEFMKNVHVKKGRVFVCRECNKKVPCVEGYLYDKEEKTEE